MSTAPPPVDHLLDAVKRLPPDALAEFTARLAEWQESPENPGPTDAFLIEQTRQCLAAGDAQRLRELGARSEDQTLGPAELDEYRQLARRAERITAARAQALAELARRRSQPVGTLKQDIGWQDIDHAA